MAEIHVDEKAITQLKNALQIAGKDYQNNFKRLTNLIEQITSDSIKGDVANDLLAKYQAKEETLKQISQTIDEAEGYMGMKETGFKGLNSDLMSGMK